MKNLEWQKDFAETLFNTAQAIILVLDTQGRIVRFNPYMEEISGYRLDEVCGKDWFDTFLPPEDREAIRELFQKAVGDKQTRGNVNPIVRRDGQKRYIEWHDKTLKDAQGKTTGILAVGQDVSEAEKARVSLRKSEIKFRTIFDKAGAAIFLADPASGTLLDCNAQAEILTGRQRDEIVGMPQSKLHPDGEAGKYGQKFKEHVSRGHVSDFEGVIQRKDGVRVPVIISAELIHIEGKDLLMGVFTDIGERKQIEERLNKTLEESLKSREIMLSMLDDNNQVREELEKRLQELKETQNMLVQSEKLASLGKLVSDMAHEVNNPLMVVSGRAQLSLMEDIKNETLKSNLKIIEDQCQRAREIIQRLLMFSRPSKGEVKELDINAALDFVVELIEHRFSLMDIKIVKAYASSLPKVKVDEKQMHEVFMNLTKNAAEAMNGGGTITITTSQEKDMVRIDIKDTGSGIPEEAMKKIFDPFFTTKEMGTGLGLSVCYGVVQSHGGDLKYASTLGKGTTATVLLPISKEA